MSFEDSDVGDPKICTPIPATGADKAELTSGPIEGPSETILDSTTNSSNRGEFRRIVKIEETLNGANRIGHITDRYRRFSKILVFKLKSVLIAAESMVGSMEGVEGVEGVGGVEGVEVADETRKSIVWFVKDRRCSFGSRACKGNFTYEEERRRFGGVVDETLTLSDSSEMMSSLTRVAVVDADEHEEAP